MYLEDRNVPVDDDVNRIAKEIANVVDKYKLTPKERKELEHAITATVPLYHRKIK